MGVDCNRYRRNGGHVRTEEAEMAFSSGNGVRGNKGVLGMGGHAVYVRGLGFAAGGMVPPQVRKLMQSCRK